MENSKCFALFARSDQVDHVCVTLHARSDDYLVLYCPLAVSISGCIFI